MNRIRCATLQCPMTFARRLTHPERWIGHHHVPTQRGSGSSSTDWKSSTRAHPKRQLFLAQLIYQQPADNRDFMQRRFTERRANANQCFVIGHCHGNGALFDVGVGAICASNVVHKVPNLLDERTWFASSPGRHWVVFGWRVGVLRTHCVPLDPTKWHAALTTHSLPLGPSEKQRHLRVPVPRQTVYRRCKRNVSSS